MQTKRKPDGGPVYPQPDNVQYGGTGLSLRDHAALLAMQGMITAGTIGSPAVICRKAYELADAMIGARTETAAAE